MLTNDRTKIILMNPVRIDYRLSKFKKDQPDKAENSGSAAFLTNPSAIAGNTIGVSFGSRDFDGDSDVMSDGRGGLWMTGLDNATNMWDGIPFSVQRRFRTKAARTVVELYIKFRLLFDKPQEDPTEIFGKVKDNFKALEDSEISTPQMLELIRQLEKARQYKAVTEAKHKKNLIELEEKLIKADIKQYQTEQTLISFILQSKKGLCLTEIENFDRVIPSDVIDKIEAAEALKIFDNYYILHYDPTGAENAFKKLTDKPKRIEKDPIVFGVINGSDKLYYIADWIDKYCSLTYTELLKTNPDMKLEFKAEK
jgi:hypothetical protein